MAFSLKPKQTPRESNIDYDAIAAQVDEGTNAARVSIIVDLGIQARGMGVNKDEPSVYTSIDEANDALAQIKEIVGKDANNFTITPTGSTFTINGSLREKADAQEVAVFADVPDTLVTYVEGGDALPYRQLLNPTFKGEIRGFPLTASKPNKAGGVWTFDSKSWLAKLAVATKHPEVLSEGDDNMDIGKFLGEPLLVTLQKKGSFINAIGVSPLMKGQSVSDLPFEPIGISFSTATVEELKAAKLRLSVINKIKQAKNYEGSAIQRAIEALAAEYASKGSATPAPSRSAPKTQNKAAPATYEADDLDDQLPF